MIVKLKKLNEQKKCVTYAYLMGDDSEVKKAKGTKKCVIKREIACLVEGSY